MEKDERPEDLQGKYICGNCGAVLKKWETVCPFCGAIHMMENPEGIQVREKSEYGTPEYDPMAE